VHAVLAVCLAVGVDNGWPLLVVVAVERVMFGGSVFCRHCILCSFGLFIEERVPAG